MQVVSPTHRVVDVTFDVSLKKQVMSALARADMPFGLEPTWALCVLLGQPRDTLEDVWDEYEEAAELATSRAERLPGVWTLDLEHREMLVINEACMRLSCEVDEAIGLACWLSFGAEDVDGARGSRLARLMDGTVSAYAQRPVVLLDLDGTILDLEKRWRPGAIDFVSELATFAEIGLWSASSQMRVYSVAHMLEELSGVSIRWMFSIKETMGIVCRDSSTGMLDLSGGEAGYRKSMRLLRTLGLDPRRTILVDDAREHWSGQHNQLAFIPGSHPFIEWDDEAVLGELAAHLRTQFHEHEDVRMAHPFMWRQEWSSTNPAPAFMYERTTVHAF